MDNTLPENRRRLIRLEVGDFLEIRPLQEVARKIEGKSKNFSLMGICFTSQVQWKRGEFLLIDYFIPAQYDSVKLKVIVVWSERISSQQGYFCGGEILEVEEEKEEIFAHYYFKKLKERFYQE